MTVIYYNKDAYSLHCKEYNQYQTWLKERNTQRYVDTKNHGQQIDGKNLMHCVRLLNCAREIAEHGRFDVFRPNREELLKIRKGDVDLKNLINWAENELLEIDELFQKSNLPENCDFEKCSDLIKEVRFKNLMKDSK